MTKKPIHYVYEHWRPDTGVIFYVGKGKGRRAFEMKWGRNKWHKAIVSKLTTAGLAVDIRFVQRDMTNDEAIIKEIGLIAYWRSLGAVLVNLTDGGEGITGVKFSEETRAKMSRDRKGRKLTEEQCRDLSRRLTGLKKSPEHIAKVAAATANINVGRKQKPEHVSKRLATTLSRNPNHFIELANRGARPVVCLNDGIVYKTLTEAAKAYGVEKGRVFDACSGRTRHTLSGLFFRYAEQWVPNASFELKVSSRAKKIVCLDDGMAFASASAAARHYGLKKADSITGVCSGKTNRLRAAGRRFKFVDAA